MRTEWGGGAGTPGRAGAFPTSSISPPALPELGRAAGGGPEGGLEADTKSFPSLPSLPSSSRSSPARKPSPTPVRGATGHPRLPDLRGGPARGKGRWQRRPHPLRPHPDLGSPPEFCGASGAGCCTSHSPPLPRRPGERAGERVGRGEETRAGGSWSRQAPGLTFADLCAGGCEAAKGAGAGLQVPGVRVRARGSGGNGEEFRQVLPAVTSTCVKGAPRRERGPGPGLHSPSAQRKL